MTGTRRPCRTTDPVHVRLHCIGGGCVRAHRRVMVSGEDATKDADLKVDAPDCGLGCALCHRVSGPRLERIESPCVWYG
jgi:hypothetical protein